MAANNAACQNQFLGSRISLISKSDIRYEGVLYALDLTEATISLAKVRSFGTEDRPTERPMPTRDDLYEYIIFRGADIKIIDIVEPPKQANHGASFIPSDPAIVDFSHSGNVNGHYGAHSDGGGHTRPQANLLDNLFNGRKGPPPMHNGGGGGSYGRRSGGYSDDGVHVGRNNNQNRHNMGMNMNGGGGGGGGGGMGGGQGRQQYGGRNNFMGYGMNYRQGGGYMNQRDNGGQFQHRGSRMTTPNRGVNFGQRNGGRQGGGGPRTPFRTRGMNQAAFPPKVAFDGDYDFEKANEELISSLAKAKLEDESGDNKDEANENGTDENTDDKDSRIFYKKDEFFDNISCESLERSKGNVPRVDWKAERKLNAETFGLNPNNMNNRNNNIRIINSQRRGIRMPRGLNMMNLSRNGLGGNRMMIGNNSGYFRI